jgi:hypothetical protein
MKPLNKHVKIEPVKQDTFLSSGRATYEEIGVVIECAADVPAPIPNGSLVYFDSWLAKKYPVKGTDDHVWFVLYDDIVAYEAIPE